MDLYTCASSLFSVYKINDHLDKPIIGLIDYHIILHKKFCRSDLIFDKTTKQKLNVKY